MASIVLPVGSSCNDTTIQHQLKLSKLKSKDVLLLKKICRDCGIGTISGYDMYFLYILQIKNYIKQHYNCNNCDIDKLEIHYNEQKMFLVL